MYVRQSVIALVVLATAACATPRATPSKRALSGVELFEQLCASCHGLTGQGDGPVAPLIKIHVPDLTRLAARDGGEFPTEDVRRIIDGRTDRRAHGPRDMPVWGWQLYDTSNSNDADERARTSAVIDQLVTYLRSIQRE